MASSMRCWVCWSWLACSRACEMLIMVLAFVVAILAIICGFACIKGNNGMASVLGLIFAIVGLISLVYAQISQDAFNLFDCITMVLGVAIFYLARKN